jgi:hypothetical protein
MLSKEACVRVWLKKELSQLRLYVLLTIRNHNNRTRKLQTLFTRQKTLKRIELSSCPMKLFHEGKPWNPSGSQDGPANAHMTSREARNHPKMTGTIVF